MLKSRLVSSLLWMGEAMENLEQGSNIDLLSIPSGDPTPSEADIKVTRDLICVIYVFAATTAIWQPNEAVI